MGTTLSNGEVCQPIPRSQSPQVPDSPRTSIDPEIRLGFLGQYRYSPYSSRILGKGAYGRVFEGKDQASNNKVAIKVVNKSKLKPLSKMQLTKEADIMRQISHPNVVSFLEGDESPDYIYIIMEYCNGGDLRLYLEHFVTLSEETIRCFILQMRSGMQELRRKNIIHRDLKPANILLCYNGSTSADVFSCDARQIILKIADFGFAKYLKDGELTSSLVGTREYMAPEVIIMKPYDVKVDMFSIGVILYECLTGKRPFNVEDWSASLLRSITMHGFNSSVNNRVIFPEGTSRELNGFITQLIQMDWVTRLSFDGFMTHKLGVSTEGRIRRIEEHYEAIVISHTQMMMEQSQLTIGARLERESNRIVNAAVNEFRSHEDVVLLINHEAVKILESQLRQRLCVVKEMVITNCSSLSKGAVHQKRWHLVNNCLNDYSKSLWMRFSRRPPTSMKELQEAASKVKKFQMRTMMSDAVMKTCTHRQLYECELSHLMKAVDARWEARISRKKKVRNFVQLPANQRLGSHSRGLRIPFPGCRYNL